MKQQNEGLPHYESFVDSTGRAFAVFVNSAQIGLLPESGIHTTLRENSDYLADYADEVFPEDHILDRLYVRQKHPGADHTV